MRLTDEQITWLIEACQKASDDGFGINITDPASLHALATELLESRAEIARLHSALTDLVSWVPERPTSPVWQLEAGAHGADDAIAAARAVISKAVTND